MKREKIAWMIDEKWKRPKEERIRKRIREWCRWKEKR